ncbi:hypothetical protein Tco_1398601, partial [Tanacetum coccineum]
KVAFIRWIQAQKPKVVLDGVKVLKDEVGDSDELDNEAVVKAYVNIVVGACISLALLLPWLRFADLKDERAHELLYSYVFAFLNEIKPISVKKLHGFLKG